jgi:hypothetical protein
MQDEGGGQLHPDIAKMLKEAEEAYAAFVVRMHELEAERQRLYEQGVRENDQKKAQALREQLHS